MTPYDTNHHGRINFFDLAGTPCTLFEPEPLNAFESIDAILHEPEEPLEAYFWDQPDSPYPWNLYWTEAARHGGGLAVDDPVFGDSWTKYKGMHVGCDDWDICYCEHNCGGTHTTVGRAPGALSTIYEVEEHYPEDIVPTFEELLNEEPNYEW
jgi:hypothetical protein